MAQTIIIIGFIQIYFQPINKKLTRTEKQTYCTYLFIGRLIYRSSESKTHLYEHIAITKIRLIISTTT